MKREASGGGWSGRLGGYAILVVAVVAGLVWWGREGGWGNPWVAVAAVAGGVAVLFGGFMGWVFRPLIAMVRRTTTVGQQVLEWEEELEERVAARTEELQKANQQLAHEFQERDRLERQLRHAQKMEAVARLAGGVAHDFNNLLTAIMGYGQLVADRVEDAVRPDIEEIVRAAQRGAALTRQLLIFSRKQVSTSQVIHVNQTIRELEKMWRRLIGEDVTLVMQLGPETGTIRADPSQFEQVMMNLVLNARDAMPQGGTLEMTIAHAEGGTLVHHGDMALHDRRYLRITVRDDGVGMTDEVKSHLFEPFFTTKEPGKGTGLGLAMVYGIVKQSEGLIAIESREGHGTTVQMWWPCWDESAAPSAPKAFEAPSSWPKGTETILVTEDEESVRRMVCHTLRKCGYEVLEARHGREAIELAAKFDRPIHLLLTDVVMPMMGGYELAESMRASRQGVKVLFMSAYTDPTRFRQADPRGSLLQKPFALDVLARKVRGVLDSSPTEAR